MEYKDTSEYLKEWEGIVNSVDKTNIPIQFVNRIIFESESFDVDANSDTNQVDIASLRELGYPDDIIREIFENVINEVKQYNGTMDFLLNIEEIARVIQQHTNKYLQKE